MDKYHEQSTDAVDSEPEEPEEPEEEELAPAEREKSSSNSTIYGSEDKEVTEHGR